MSYGRRMSTTDDQIETDAELAAWCSSVIDVPKVAPPDSFVLHAPLELLARAILLERVTDDARPLARERMRWLVDRYEHAGPPAATAPVEVDLAIDDVVTSLAAAGHAPILLNLRPRVAAVPPTFGSR